MKISYFNYLYDLDGASLGSAVKARRLMDALGRLGHQVALHWRNPGANAAMRNGRVSMAARMRERLSPWLNFPMSVLRGLADLAPEERILQEERPDVVVTRLELGRCAGALLCGLGRLPLVVEADAPVCYEQRRFLTHRHLPPWLPERLEMATLRAADAVFTPSDVMREYFVARGVPGERIVTIENGADTRSFRPRPAGGSARDALGIGRSPVVGFSGSLAPWHDVGVMLGAFEEILDRDASCVLLVVGSGGGHAKLLEEWSEERAGHGRFFWVRHATHERMPRIMAAMDVVLMPAPPMPLPYFSPVKLFEAMACGCLVVAARQGQVAQIVRDGENGFLYTPGDATEMVRCTLAALSHQERRQIGRAARETIEARYTWEIQAERLERLLAGVLAGRPER